MKHWLNLKGPTQPTALEGIRWNCQYRSRYSEGIEISSQFNLHVGTTFLADFTAVSITLEHLDHGHKAFSMLSIGGTNDKAGVAWNNTTLREKVAPAFVHHISLVAVRFSFSPCVSVAISNFGRLDIWLGEFEFFGWHEFTTFYFRRNFAIWCKLLRPSLLYQRSVKRRHHWACPMCLCGTLRWSGGGGVVDGLLPIWKFLTWKFFVSWSSKLHLPALFGFGNFGDFNLFWLTVYRATASVWYSMLLTPRFQEVSFVLGRFICCDVIGFNSCFKMFFIVLLIRLQLLQWPFVAHLWIWHLWCFSCQTVLILWNFSLQFILGSSTFSAVHFSFVGVLSAG